MCLKTIKSLGTAALGLTFIGVAGTFAGAQADKPLHFVEKVGMRPQLETRLSQPIAGAATEEDLLVASKAFIADLRGPGRIRFRELIDPRYLKQHGLTDRDLAYEISDNTGLHHHYVADDLRTVLLVLDAKGGGQELMLIRWVTYEGHLYLSPEKGPDSQTGIFKPWLLRTKFIEQKPAVVRNGNEPLKLPHIVEAPDQQGSNPRPQVKISGEPTEDHLLARSKSFLSAIRSPVEHRFREYFDPRYLQKHGLTDRDIAFESAASQRIIILDVADDHRTVLCGTESREGQQEAMILRYATYEDRLYIAPENAPDPTTAIFQPWILRTKLK